ncbi:presenilins-associated rhomboid-like protein, mitochondrial [Octopus bimaculoides]|uniref:rhomboid protease n=1 Tax=Octopus bimaculoides TaxID=37653 RepID=A0A0L8GWK2_OCTBM|nr:presenilins-associated rhomboid-like protein, mitochondrial [Octopus bimaculoides]|eukprot:XP_014777461.1 PREDICTED: presenilins-associated rhomboid-like protein, mitochondrial [Octopus bimaculoides]
MAASRLGSLCSLNLLRVSCFQQVWHSAPVYRTTLTHLPRKSQWRTPLRKFHQRSRRRDDLIEIKNGYPTYRDLLKPLGFTIMFSGACFAGSMVWQYELTRLKAKKIISNWISNEGRDIFYPKSHSFRSHLNMWWNSLSDGQKYVVSIIGANVLVFLAWRLPSAQPTLMKYFCSNPNSAAPCWSMLLSAFSQYNFMHLFTNMYVLWSFSNVALNLFGKEQFLAFYLSSATVASLLSYCVKITRCQFTPSVGASGALMAVLGAVCLTYPNAQLSIAFIGDIIPHSFSAGAVMKVIIVFDTIGVLAGWKFFDHAAHLGGMLFGLWYVTYGKKLIWEQRESVQKWWHHIRGDP